MKLEVSLMNQWEEEKCQKPTDNKFWGKFHRNRHNNSHESVKIFCISHTLLRPGNIDRPYKKGEEGNWDLTFREYSGHLHPFSGTLTTRIYATKGSTRIKATSIITMYWDIKNTGVINKSSLCTIPWVVSYCCWRKSKIKSQTNHDGRP